MKKKKLLEAKELIAKVRDDTFEWTLIAASRTNDKDEINDYVKRKFNKKWKTD
jgi:hypothetical protein